MRATPILTQKMVILHIDILIEGSQCHTQSGRIVPDSPQEIMLVPVPSLSSTNPMPIRGPRHVALLKWTSQMMEPS